MISSAWTKLRGVPERKKRASTESIAAPVGGWNVRDSLAAMPPTDAVILDNWFPTTTDCVVRNGYSNWATGITGTVETIMAYNGQSKKLFACAGTQIYDATALGAVGAAVVTGLTNARWQFVNMGTPGGQFLMAVNGTDNLLLFDGTTWEKVTGVSAHAITGIATTSFSNINIFKRRVWLVEKNSLRAWYLPTNSIAGAATVFDFSSLFPNGGSIVALGTWTVDAGQGPDDNLAIFTSEGDVAIYQGTDPASSTTFALVGIYTQGRPVGMNPQIKFGGDVLVITDQGVDALSQSILTAQVSEKTALTDKIKPAMADAIINGYSTLGWQLLAHPSKNALILNVPNSLGQTVQFVMNTITGAWCRFTGWAASCFEVQGNKLYFGAAGVVNLAWSGYSDSGTVIQADGLAAFNAFGRLGQNKQWTMVRPFLLTTGTPSIRTAINVDFDTTAITSALSFSGAPSSMIWGSMIWGLMIWGGNYTPIRSWQYASGFGEYGALRLKVQNNFADVKWESSEYVFMDAGVV